MGWITETTRVHIISCNEKGCLKEDAITRARKKDAADYFKRRGWSFLDYGHRCPDCELKRIKEGKQG